MQRYFSIKNETPNKIQNILKYVFGNFSRFFEQQGDPSALTKTTLSLRIFFPKTCYHTIFHRFKKRFREKNFEKICQQNIFVKNIYKMFFMTDLGHHHLIIFPIKMELLKIFSMESAPLRASRK